MLVANLVYFPLVRLPDSQRRRAGLLLTVVSNLLFLGSFKYFNFFIDRADRLLAGFGLSSWDWRFHIILPVGISFYTFQSLSSRSTCTTAGPVRFGDSRTMPFS